MEKENRLLLAILLSVTFMIIEVIGGYMANSIAIFSDAAHLLTDVAGFVIALIATIAAKSPGTKTLTFGLARAEVFGALASILSLWVITAFLLYAAFFRALAWFEGHADDVQGGLMFIVACFGVLVNICLGMVFHDEHGGDFHPAHSHDHGHASHDSSHGHAHEHSSSVGGSNSHSCNHSELDKNAGGSDVEAPAAAGGDGHSHSHGHSHGHGHNHGNNETSPLLGNGKNGSSSTSSSSSSSSSDGGHSSSHDHDHSSHDHDHSIHDHDHGSVVVEDRGNSSSGGHGYQSIDSGHSESHHPHHHASDVNIEAAYLHVITDLIQSIGVAIAGAVLYFKPHWQIIDPICTFIFSFIALRSTLPLINRVTMILFEGTPSNVDWELVMSEFCAVEGVEDVHDLHIWSISSKSISLTCHIRAQNPQCALKETHAICRKLGIDHATIQAHDTSDEHFCYSETCDGHEDDEEGESEVVADTGASSGKNGKSGKSSGGAGGPCASSRSSRSGKKPCV